jgi:hypothetical protein
MNITRQTKTKLTLSIDKNILTAAKKACDERRIPISRLVEKFLSWVTEPEVFCFRCGRKLVSSDAKICPKCGWMICAKCKACGCKLSGETATAVFHMRRIYEELLCGRIKS